MPLIARADSVVVFNEIMYHPQTNEAALEWVELHNQMAVDVDLSGWRIRGGIEYDFPAGTVLGGGGYLVVALSPAQVMASAGLSSNVFGPFTGRLSNNGDILELQNNNKRLMDEVEYDVQGEWPVAADGAGPSLAKLNEGSSGEAANWRPSRQTGGTPGRSNGLRLNGTNVPPVATLAFNEISTVSNAQFWVELVNYGSQNVALGNFVLSRFGNTNREYVLPAQTLAPGEFLVLDRNTIGFGADPGDAVVLYAPGKTNVVDALTAKSFAQSRHPQVTGPWLRSTDATPGASNVVQLRNDIVINEILFQPRPLPAMAAVYYTNTLLTITNGWRYNQTGQDPGADWTAPEYDDSTWLSGRGLFYTNISVFPAPRGTTLALSNAQQPVITYYFRTAFVFTNSTVGIELNLNPIIDDGAIFYLNGVDVYRYGMPTGEVTSATLASTNIGLPNYSGPLVIPSDALVAGTNIFAVEVHQYVPPPASRDIAFAAQLTLVGTVTPAVPERESTESWIELHNLSSNAVDLTGWRLDEGIRYAFDTGTTIPAGGYLVVAKDVAVMLANYPGVTVVGPFTNNLSGSSDHLLLRDANGNPADEVRYYDRSPWPRYPGGLGASLELRDPRADNSVPEAWAASDTSAAAQWQTYTYRGVAKADPAPSPTQWNEFVLGLLGPGEVLLDDISVIENPDTTRRQLIQNGKFETGQGTWRIVGNHRGEVITDPANPNNKVLRLVTSGDTGHMHNHVETTFTNNVSIINGTEYEISFRARWVAGCEKINTRLYFNRLARTTRLSVPAAEGTPGARNSQFAANLGPTFSDLRHGPVIPTSGQAVTVTANVSDPDGVASAALFYSVNGGGWQSNVMTLTNTSTGLALRGTIPAQGSSSIVQFYIRAADTTGATATYPAGGANSRALYKVSGGETLPARLHQVRIIMTPADATFMHTPTNVMSNHRLLCTVIYNDRDVFYDSAVHLQGSERGRNETTRVGFSVNLPADRLLRGVHDGFTIDRSGGYSGKGGKHDEILLKHAVNRAGGLPGMYDDLVQVYTPRVNENGTGILILAKYGQVFLDSEFEDGNDGEMYKLELIYYPTTTATGDPQGLKLPLPDSVIGGDIRDYGVDPEAYRWHFLKENHAARDNYEPMVRLAQTMSLTGTNFATRISEVMDVDEWMRAVAFLSLIGGDDIYTYGNQHNLMIYFRPEDQQAMAFLWDMDYSFVAAVNKAFPGNGSATTYKLITTVPHNYRRYYNHLYDLSAITGNSAYMSQWANRYAGMLGQNWSTAVQYLVDRAAFVRSAMPLNMPFTISNNGGTNYSVSSNTIVLTGTAPMSVRDIEINGVDYPLTWTSLTNWTITVPLPSSINTLVAQAIDNQGNVITNSVDSIVVTNEVAPSLAPVVINEWMADNAGPGGYPDPLDNQFQDWVELFNPNQVAVDLSGYFLTDNLAQPGKWMFPANTVIAPLGYLLVWADEELTQNGQGSTGDRHADFKLGAGGEALGLFNAGGTRQHAVTFGPQFQNVSQGLFPDGNTNDIRFMTNWTPRAANQIGGVAPAPIQNLSISAGGSVAFTYPAQPHRAYRVDYKDSLNAAAWTPLSTNRTSNGSISVNDAIGARQQRFYRVVLLP